MTRFISAVTVLLGIGVVVFGLWCILYNDESRVQIVGSVAMSISGVSVIATGVSLWMLQRSSELLDKMIEDLK